MNIVDEILTKMNKTRKRVKTIQKNRSEKEQKKK